MQGSSSGYLARRMNQLMSRILNFSLFFVVSVHFGIGEAHQIQPASPEQVQEAQAEQPVFRTGINFVRVDVIVTDNDDNPVTDLTIEDFEVFEDGDLQTVETLQFFEISSIQSSSEPPKAIRSVYDEEVEANRPDVRLFAFFMDDYHVRRGAGLRIIEPLVNFIRNDLSPSDLIAVMYPLTPLTDVRMTRNHEAIIDAIEKFRGRKYEHEPRNGFEMRYASASAETVEFIRNEVSLTALRALMTRLGGLREGRKSVILVSEGYTNIVPPQLRNPIASEFDNPRQRNPFIGSDDPRESARQMMADVSIRTDLERVFDTANRNNTSIYALDPRGLASFEFDIDSGVGFTDDSNMLRSTMATLRDLAETTDGRAIVNRNDPTDGLRQAVRDSSAYYLLGYTSNDTPTDGRFHEIRVRLKRRGLNVRARKGYWALSQEDLERLEAPAPAAAPSDVDLALRVLEARRNATQIQTWIGTAKGNNGLSRMTFVWRPIPRVPGRASMDVSGVEVVARDEGGTTFFEGLVPAETAIASQSDLSPSTEKPVQLPIVTFDVEPGLLRLDLSIQGADGRVLDNDVQNFTVPDFTEMDVALSSAMVFRASNAYEMRQLRTQSEAVPEIGREFRRGDQLLIRFETYALSEASLSVEAGLLNRAGDVMAKLPVVLTSAGSDFYELGLPLANLAPGEYLVELTASIGLEPVRQLIAFRVTS